MRFEVDLRKVHNHNQEHSAIRYTGILVLARPATAFGATAFGATAFGARRCFRVRHEMVK